MYTHIYIPYLMYVLYRNVIILVVGDFFFNKRYYTGDTLLQLAQKLAWRSILGHEISLATQATKYLRIHLRNVRFYVENYERF